MYKKPQKETDLVDEILRDFDRLKGDRENFESHWLEIAERVIPSHRTQFQSLGSQKTKGEKRTEFIFDSTASIALGRFAAILDSLLTPRNQTWHRLLASDPYLNKDRQVRLWFEEVNRILFKNRYAPDANFASQNQQNYKSLGAFGTGCLFIDKLQNRKEKGLRYKNIHLAEVFFSENHQGIIDTAYRYFELTCRQARQKWGDDKLPKSIIDCENQEQNFWFIHCVKPRTDYDPGRFDYKGMEYGSYYVCQSERCLVDEGGYTTFPYASSRYEQSPGEVYGRSPAMEVLPAIKTLNEQKKTMLKQGHRIVDPVLLVHDDGVLDSVSLKPGAINYGGVTADGRPLVHPLPVGRVDVGIDMMQAEQALINDAFLITLFQIMVENPQTMTATEVLERSKEKGILLAPTIGRQHSEYLGPMIDRELDILAQEGLIPPMPGLLKEAKGDYRIEYDSPLSRAQRAEEAAGLARTLETVLNVVNITQNAEPLDHFDWDNIVPDVADIQAVPMRWMKDMRVIQQIRQARAQQQQMMQMSQMAPGAAAMIKSVGAVQGK